jgi:uncharacterized protein YjiS (DUF1127 family)
MTNVNATVLLHKPGTAHYGQAARAVVRIVALILEPLARAYRARRDAEYLMSLSDHLLKDIGIARCEIEPVVRRGRPDDHCRG